MSTRTLPAVAVLLAAVGPASAAHAEDLWPKMREDCEATAFKDPAGAELARIARCARLWEAYKDVRAAKADQKEAVVAALKRLYVEGSEVDAHVAKGALARLGVGQLPERRRAVAAAAGPSAAAAPARPRCDVPEPDKKALKAAEKAFKKGFGHYKKKKYENALAEYLKAVDAAPGWSKGRYNAAAIYALLGDEANAMKQLYCLQDIADDAAASYLKKAWTDTDFEPIRDKSAPFKALTGYARIKIGNSLGEYGEDNVDNLQASLEKLGYQKVVIEPDVGREYEEPHIWYKPECKSTAYFLIKLMDHDETQVATLDPSYKGYDEFDVLVAWGDKVVKGKEPRLRIKDPDDAEDKLDSLARDQDRMLRKPEEAARDVEHVVDTPERIGDKATRSVDRTKKTVDKIEKAGDKVKGLFD